MNKHFTLEIQNLGLEIDIKTGIHEMRIRFRKEVEEKGKMISGIIIKEKSSQDNMESSRKN